MIKDLIISDIHLGNPSCNTGELWDLLTDFNYESLIINGDLFSCHHFDKLNRFDLKIIRLITWLQEKGTAILIEGNHELHIDLKKFPKLKFVKNYIWERFGYRFGAIHGHAVKMADFTCETEKRAHKFASKNDLSVVFAGHNHTAKLKRDEDTDTIYVNTGSFVDYFNYYAVTKNEHVHLERIQQEKLDFTDFIDTVEV